MGFAEDVRVDPQSGVGVCVSEPSRDLVNRDARTQPCRGGVVPEVIDGPARWHCFGPFHCSPEAAALQLFPGRAERQVLVGVTICGESGCDLLGVVRERHQPDVAGLRAGFGVPV